MKLYRGVFYGLLFSLIGFWIPVSIIVWAQPTPPPTLSSDLMLKAQVQALSEQLHGLQIQFAQCRASSADTQAKLDGALLTVQASYLKDSHEALTRELLKSYGGQEGDTIDWSTSPPTLKKKAEAQKP